MFEAFPIRWIVYAIAVFVAMKCWMGLSALLRDRLQGLLMDHVKRQQVESLKRRQISDLRAQIRDKKAAEIAGEEAKRLEAPRNEQKTAA